MPSTTSVAVAAYVTTVPPAPDASAVMSAGNPSAGGSSSLKVDVSLGRQPTSPPTSPNARQ